MGTTPGHRDACLAEIPNRALRGEYGQTHGHTTSLGWRVFLVSKSIQVSFSGVCCSVFGRASHPRSDALDDPVDHLSVGIWRWIPVLSSWL